MNLKASRMFKLGILPLLLSSTLLASCGGSSGGDNGENSGNTQEEVDDTKFQLRIHNFAGGYGTDWLNHVKEAYETLHAHDTYEGGKVGIQIHISGDKTTFDGPEISAKPYEIYFAEQSKYAYYASSGYIEDITEAVSGANPYEKNKTIESKMDDTQKAFYGYTLDDGKTHYYGIPHYSGTYGINYNIDLFEKEGLFFKKNHPDVSLKDDYNKYFTDDRSDLAFGPDGQEGTGDDGLPETFQEFYFLCDYINSLGIYPIVYAGSNYTDYTANFIGCMLGGLLGKDQTTIQYSFNGNAMDLVKIGNDGTPLFDANGNPVLEDNPIAITDQNGYDVTRSRARYDVLSFLDTIFDNSSKWIHDRSKNQSYKHLDAQRDFIYGKQGNKGKGKDVAMLIDGSWWQAEAKSAWEYMEKNFQGKQSPMVRNFGLMPFPKARKEDAYHSTYLDVLNSLEFVRKGVTPEQKKVSVDFLQFMNTDEQLAKFTETTYVTRCLNYTLSDEQLNKLSIYGKSLYNLKHDSKTEIIYPFSKNNIYANHQELFEPGAYFRSKVNGRTYNYPAEPFRQNICDAKTLFQESYAYYKNQWPSLN